VNKKLNCPVSALPEALKALSYSLGWTLSFHRWLAILVFGKNSSVEINSMMWMLIPGFSSVFLHEVYCAIGTTQTTG